MVVELNEYECLVDGFEILRIIAKHSKFFEVQSSSNHNDIVLHSARGSVAVINISPKGSSIRTEPAINDPQRTWCTAVGIALELLPCVGLFQYIAIISHWNFNVGGTKQRLQLEAGLLHLLVIFVTTLAVRFVDVSVYHLPVHKTQLNSCGGKVVAEF